MAIATSWEQHHHIIKPIPILQWLVVLVLSAHILLGNQDALSTFQAIRFVSLMLVSNIVCLYILPNLINMTAVATILVLLDTLLVPATLYATGTTGTDLFVVYFGIIMIAGAAGSLPRALLLATVTCVAYGAFALLYEPGTTPLGSVLLRMPFFLVVTLFYGLMGEFAERERKDKERLAYAATHDELTGMPNRRHIQEALTRALEEAKRFESPLSCAMMDIDGFKRINDTYGHDAGDQILREYASVLIEQRRGYDLVGRVGGDEYVWLLPRVDTEGAIAAGERLRKAVERTLFRNGDRTIPLTTSIGMTTYEPGKSSHPSPATMLKVADLALYTAKRKGRNQVCHMPLLDQASDWEPQLQP
ncbi:GGDEF domain-containing protein [Nitrospira sp. Kam-Ns4a]